MEQPPSQDVVRARTFELIDQNGNVRMNLEMMPYGDAEQPLITMYDEGGQIRGMVGLQQDGSPEIDLTGSDGSHVRLSSRPDGSNSLDFYDHNRTIRARLAVQHHGPSGLALYESSGQLLHTFPKGLR